MNLHSGEAGMYKGRMSLEAQRIAIAEAAGLSKIKGRGLMMVHGYDTEHHAFAGKVPDYLSDLNAMHEAEKKLFPKLTHKYKLALADLPGFGGNNHDRIWHATAAQRAEAFLHTVGKWNDTK